MHVSLDPHLMILCMRDADRLANLLCQILVVSICAVQSCRLAKEREVEDHLFGDKESFVTAAYKKKLEEDKKWLAEEAIREEQEKRDDVKKRGHMGDFYRSGSLNSCLSSDEIVHKPQVKTRAIMRGCIHKVNGAAQEEAGEG